MVFSPRWYQQDLINGVRYEWSQGHKSVVVVSPPRSGKTPLMVWLAEPFIKSNQGVVINAHREELVRQLAMTFAEFGYTHNIMAPKDVIADIIRRQYKQFGRSFYDQRALVMIGSVQTINARSSKLTTFAPRVGLWMTDEAHHLLADNQWGKVIKLFPDAYGIGFTATPGRTDRKSLAREQGGVFDTMVKGVTARQLINEGYICDYRIIAPPSSIDRAGIKVGGGGEFTKKGLLEAKRESTITGDCVKSYLKYTPDQQAVVFAVNINHAIELTEAYREADLSAEMVSSKTPKNVRKLVMDKFERGVFKILVNVDLFGEGLNVEGIEVVIMARPTQSFVLYVQQFFRALTRGDDKHFGTIIDHAGNVGYFGNIYGLPDSYNGWELLNEARGKKRNTPFDPDLVKIKTCVECYSPYEAFLPQCPKCGHKDVPAERSSPEHVDGDLVELDLETLAALRGEIERIGRPPVIPNNLRNTAAEKRLRNLHVSRQEAQASLCYNISLWAGYWRDCLTGREDMVSELTVDSAIYRKFYDEFGIDIMTAQALNTKDATELSERVDTSVQKYITMGNNGE